MGSKIIRKSIDLPEVVLKRLKTLADSDRRKIKNYLEKVLIEHSGPSKQTKGVLK